MNNNLKPVYPADQKSIMIHILDEIDSFCTKNGITYYLTYGTLLGAVRHKGFIPWDDDVDIVMSRNDYEKFSMSFNEERTDSLRFVSIDNTPGYYLLSSKVCDTRTVLIEGVSSPIELGVYVDVFINDSLSDSLEGAKKIVRGNRRLFNLIKAKSIADRDGRSKYKQLIINVMRKLSKVIDSRKVLKKIEKLSEKHKNNDSSKYCGSVTSLYYGEKEITETKWWGKGVKVEFEGKLYNAPSDFHSVLSAFYGDYMQLPPVDQRVTHHVHEVYWKCDI